MILCSVLMEKTMIDTLMALWNQDRRKRAAQAILTFFLMCIGISLLLVIMNRAADFPRQKASTGSGNPTVPSFGNTVVPDLTPTISVVIGTQATPPAATMQPTQVATNTPLCVTTPSGSKSQMSSFYAVLVQSSPTSTPKPRSGSGTPSVPLRHFDGGGGGPINTGTPVLPTPTSVQSTATPGPPHGWVPNCTTNNSISTVASRNVLALLAHNIWFILGSALLGTLVFYGVIIMIKQRIRAGA